MNVEQVKLDNAKKGILTIICVAMMCLCNLCMSNGLYVIGEVLIAGVPLSLFLLGYLSGLEKIEKPFKWLCSKAVYLIPYLLFIVVVYGAYEISGKADVSLMQWLFCIFDLQGLNYTVWKFSEYEAVSGFSHLWLLTTIAICYLITPLLQRIKWLDLTPIKKTGIIAILLIVQLGLLYLGIQLSYIITYAVGYIVSLKPVRTDSKWYAIVCVVAVIITSGRLVIRIVWDGTLFYNSYVALISSATIGAWVFYTVFFLAEKLSRLFKALDSGGLKKVAELSCYTYLTHYMLVRGPFSVGNYVESKLLEIILIVVLSVISGAILWFISENFILRMIRRTLGENR